MVQPDAARLLADYVGDDLARQDNELAKLALTVKDAKVRPQDVAAGVAFQREQQMSEMVNAVAAGKPAEADPALEAAIADGQFDGISSRHLAGDLADQCPQGPGNETIGNEQLRHHLGAGCGRAGDRNPRPRFPPPTHQNWT